MDDLPLIENENQNNFPIAEIYELNELDYLSIYLNLLNNK